MPHLCNMLKSLWKNSVVFIERDAQGFGFPLHLLLSLSYFYAGADHHLETIAVSQSLPNWVNQRLLQVAADKF